MTYPEFLSRLFTGDITAIELEEYIITYTHNRSAKYCRLLERDIVDYYTRNAERIKADHKKRLRPLEADTVQWPPHNATYREILDGLDSLNNVLRFVILDLFFNTIESTPISQAKEFPQELNTPEALKIFEQARGVGLIDKEYKWLKGLQLLACFAREMSLKLDLGKGCNSDGTPRISWQPFERLFDIPKGKLRTNYNDVQKTGQEPSEHTLIDGIFK